jgi:hypothetical protein
MYYCNYCDYTTNDSGNFSHHKASKKHLAQINQLKITEYDKIIQENSELKQKLAEKELELNKILIKQHADITNNTQNNTQNNNFNISALNYVNQHFKDAPVLEKITDFVINGIDTNDASQHDKFIADVIYYYNKKILHQTIGDHIVRLYKKTDLSQQSFHTTDASRLNYVIRVLENDNLINNEENNDSDSEDDRYNYLNEETMDDEQKEFFKLKKQYDKYLDMMNKKKDIQLFKKNNINNNIWITDKNGYKICQLLIEPTIKQMLTILKNRLKIKPKKKIQNLDSELKYHQAINNIIESIDTKKLKNEINKYIAPIFNLDKK